jgi:hypothetical protein
MISKGVRAMSDTTWVDGQLAELRHHWGSAYLIVCNHLGQWKADRRDNGATLTADSAGELRDAIVADYTRQPVPR